MLNFKKFAPFANRVLIRRAETVTKSKGGILLPEKAQQECSFGEIVAAGPGLTLTNGTLRPLPVKVGQTVLLPQYAGVKVKLSDQQEYWVYRDDDILGILEEPLLEKEARKK
jgi:chaperonin GroES